MTKKLAALALTLTLLTVPAAAFSDVDEGLYYAAPIAWAVEMGITTGTTETTFSPDALCTQGQILTFLWRAAGSPHAETEAAAGEDLNLDFQQAIAWALEKGILDDAAFDPSVPCGRGDAMRFLWRYAGSPASSAPGAFTDVAPDADYAQAVAWAVETGITAGTTEATFSPNETCTRGQIATFLYRCLSESAPGEVCAPEDPASPASPEPKEEVRPLRTYTAAGKAYSLGLDGSEFTSDGVYEAETTVDIYSPLEAVFTVKVPFPLYQACSYTVRFDDPEWPGEGYLFTCLRWDEAFADMISWEGEHCQYQFSDLTGRGQNPMFVTSQEEEDRMGGVLSWRIVLLGGSNFSFDLLDHYELSCEVSSTL